MLRSGKRVIRKLNKTRKDLAEFLIAEIERVAEQPQVS
jgi:hypothetical protein